MISVTSVRYFSLVISFVLSCAGASAQEQTPVYIDASECAALKLDEARLACYDAVTRYVRNHPAPAAAAPAAGVQQPAPVAAIPVAPAPAAQAPASIDPVLGVPVRAGPEPQIVRRQKGETGNEIDDFGKENAKLVRDKDGTRELRDRIASLSLSGDTRWTVTLESGQVWRQVESKRYNLRDGMEVRIYPTRWGKYYRLAADSLGSYIQVERVR